MKVLICRDLEASQTHHLSGIIIHLQHLQLFWTTGKLSRCLAWQQYFPLNTSGKYKWFGDLHLYLLQVAYKTFIGIELSLDKMLTSYKYIVHYGNHLHTGYFGQR